jgi:putative protein-disulfide isomerase
MADEFRKARSELAHRAEFDLMLGGINTHGTQPIGDYGRRFLMRLWREVADTTGVHFGFALPDEYVHNSVSACLAVEAVRQITETVPFDYLHALQEQFFVHGRDITDIELLAAQAANFGVPEAELRETVRDPVILERVRFQFENAGAFGTNALPSLLIERDGALTLFAGGYMDASMLDELLRE